jgi:hypothetical protein
VYLPFFQEYASFDFIILIAKKEFSFGTKVKNIVSAAHFL